MAIPFIVGPFFPPPILLLSFPGHNTPAILHGHIGSFNGFSNGANPKQKVIFHVISVISPRKFTWENGQITPFESIGKFHEIHLSTIMIDVPFAMLVSPQCSWLASSFGLWEVQGSEFWSFNQKFSPFNTFQKKSNLKPLPQASTHSTTAHKNTPKNR